MIKTVNMEVRSAFLGFSNGALCFAIAFYGDTFGCGTGYCSLNEHCANTIRKILETFEVNEWNDIKGKFARVQMDESNKIVLFSNIVKDKHFVLGKEY